MANSYLACKIWGQLAWSFPQKRWHLRHDKNTVDIVKWSYKSERLWTKPYNVIHDKVSWHIWAQSYSYYPKFLFF